MASREMKLAAVFSEGKSFWVEDPANAGTFLEIPGFLDWTEGDGSRDGRSTGTDGTRPHGVVSNMKAPTVDCTFLYVSHPNWDILDDALINKTNLSYRMETEGETIVAQTASGVTCAIAADGTCTFTGYTPDIDELPLGCSIKIGSALHPIVSVTGTGALTVKVSAPSSAVAAAQFSVVTPSERVSFRGKPTKVPTREHSIAQQSEREGTLTIQSLGILPKPVRIA